MQQTLVNELQTIMPEALTEFEKHKNMKQYLVLCAIIISTVFGVHAESRPALNKAEVDDYVKKMASGLTNGNICSLEIYYYPTRILTRASVTPEWLEAHYHYKLEIRDLINSGMVREMEKHLSCLSFDDYDGLCDVRYGVVCRDTKGKRIYSFYYDPLKNVMMLAKQNVKCGKDFKEWMENDIGSIFR